MPGWYQELTHGAHKTVARNRAECAGDFLTPTPSAEKTAARRDQGRAQKLFLRTGNLSLDVADQG
jgi:hypothetical protein